MVNASNQATNASNQASNPVDQPPPTTCLHEVALVKKFFLDLNDFLRVGGNLKGFHKPKEVK